MKELEIIAVLVENHYGVLARVTSLVSRRGFNIESLTVSTTDRADQSRITLSLFADDLRLGQVMHQIAKLEEVVAIERLTQGNYVSREITLIKVAYDQANLACLKDMADIYKAQIIDLSKGSLIFEITGKSSKVDAFLRILKTYKILEVSRTGVTAMERIKEEN